MLQLYAMTPKERDLRYYGILKKNVTQARQARDISYTIYCSVQPEDKRAEIWDFHPLPGDPSKKQRAKLQQQQASREIREAERMVKLYKEKGFIS